MTLPELAIKRHVTMLMIILSLVVLGAVALLRLPLAFLPDVDEPHLFVRLPYSSASPEQVERMVVRPAEDALGSLQGLRGMWSMCNEDGGVIRIRFTVKPELKKGSIVLTPKLENDKIVWQCRSEGDIARHYLGSWCRG